MGEEPFIVWPTAPSAGASRGAPPGGLRQHEQLETGEEQQDVRTCLWNNQSRCGHLPALLLRADNTLEGLRSTCTFMGLFEKWECMMEEREVALGDAILLYTDRCSGSSEW